MIVTAVLKRLLLALQYPSFPSPLVGDYQVGAIQTRIPNGPACQIHYPTAGTTTTTTSSSARHRGHGGKEKRVPYFRPQAISGLADYTRQSPALLEFLSQRQHPCIMSAPPISTSSSSSSSTTTTTTSTFPVVIFSHGLGGCMEMYTTLCQQIASQGYWVVAVEHADGSGAYAETSSGEPIYYRRPDDTPYSRNKVVNFRKDFLTQRMQEIQRVLEFVFEAKTKIDDDNDNTEDRLLRQVLEAADTQQGIHLVGHSFGGATMVQFLQQQQQQESQQQAYKVESLNVLDCWAFSLPDSSLEQGIVSTPMLSILSEAWLTNPETEQIQQLLQNSPKVTSWYIPNSVHSSFSDVIVWLPGFVTRAMRLRGPSERMHETIRTSALACVQHFQEQPVDKIIGLKEFPVQARTSTSIQQAETVLNAAAS